MSHFRLLFHAEMLDHIRAGRLISFTHLRLGNRQYNVLGYVCFPVTQRLHHWILFSFEAYGITFVYDLVCVNKSTCVHIYLLWVSVSVSNFHPAATFTFR